jgi:hypothetical protein
MRARRGPTRSRLARRNVSADVNVRPPTGPDIGRRQFDSIATQKRVWDARLPQFGLSNR